MDINRASDGELLQVLWDFHRVDHVPERVDLLLVMGSNDLSVPRHAAVLMQNGIAPLACLTGGNAHQDDLLATGWDKAEARVFRDIMHEQGVDDSRLLIEPAATNTGENVSLARKLCEDHGVAPATGLIVHKPWMQKRALHTALKAWPEVRWQVGAPDVTLGAYLMHRDFAQVANVVVGDTQRLRLYSRKGFMTPAAIPEHVAACAFELLVRGYSRHLIA